MRKNSTLNAKLNQFIVLICYSHVQILYINWPWGIYEQKE